MKKKKSLGLLIILLCYLLAIAAFVASYAYFIDNGIVLACLYGDVIATVVVFIFSLIFRNSTIYDPYWSVFPPVILMTVMIDQSLFSITTIIYFCLILGWGLRLTVNWVMTFKNLNQQDWRYDMFKNKYPHLWPLINFCGIQMFPTLIVFLSLYSGIELILLNADFNMLSLFGFALIAIGIMLEQMADVAMHAFLKSEHQYDEVNREGLWKYSRHPNYLGENLIWIGGFIALIALDFSKYYLILGPITMLSLFVFISIPMMEKRQLKKRPEYAKYQKEVSMLMLMPSGKNEGFEFPANSESEIRE